ncbi:CaiB/BaiF CoA transferase family protein [Blastococcus sp. SYSU D00669]
MGSGPLAGLRVVEFTGLAPGPFACMVLADLGADVVRIDRPGRASTPDAEVLLRGRRHTLAADLKDPATVEAVLALLDRADVLVEGFRPGVVERLGLGPDVVLARNPRLVYGRITGWGQDGPLARAAGHDIDYIALAGALHPIGERGGAPLPPANLLGDFGGGGLLMAFGVLAALVERAASGRGQVVDAAMVDGAALLTTYLHGMAARGLWTTERGANLLDGGAPFYGTYETSDGGYMAVGAIEPQFYAELLERLGLSAGDLPGQDDREQWDALRARLAKAFRGRTRDEWTAVFDGTDACVTPVLALDEAREHPHNRARGAFVEVGGIAQPAPAPRFARTPAPTPAAPSSGTDPAVLGEWGLPPEHAATLS